jgi:hypothetical protein
MYGVDLSFQCLNSYLDLEATVLFLYPTIEYCPLSSY